MTAKRARKPLQGAGVVVIWSRTNGAVYAVLRPPSGPGQSGPGQPSLSQAC